LSTPLFPPLFSCRAAASFVAIFSDALARLFWFPFAQAEVYIAMLPVLRLVTHLVPPHFSATRLCERLVVLALAAWVFWICVGAACSKRLNPFSNRLVFSLLLPSLGLVPPRSS